MRANKNLRTSVKQLTALILLLFVLLICAATMVLGTNNTAKAEVLEKTVYTNNNPGGTDYKHELRTDKNDRQIYMAQNLTGWQKKNSSSDLPMTYSSSISGTVSYQVEGSLGVNASLIPDVASISGEIKSSMGYSYSRTQMITYSYNVKPYEAGTYFCIGVNFDTIKTTIKHYKQKFKWFGQGKYEYTSTSTIRTPSETYIAKNYRYDMFGQIYES